MKDLSRRVLIVKVLPASLRPKEIKDEVVEDVEGLLNVGEAPDVVSVETRWVVLALEDSFTQQDERLRRGDLTRRPPFLPDAFECLPSAFSNGAFKEAMLRVFWDPGVTDLARGGDSHILEPSSDGQASVEGQPDQDANFAGVGIVPYPCDHLRNGRILEV
jgi:hypothetical protein